MKKTINSEHLWNYINELARNEKVKFKVYCDDSYVTNILWNGENFEWESGTFTSEAFFNPLYDFEIIEENKKIEKLDIDKMLQIKKWKRDKNAWKKINELIDEVNKLKEK